MTVGQMRGGYPRLQVSEVFESLQGEGPRAGEHSLFVRLAGCNMSCSWCDTRYAWDWHRYDRVVEVRENTVEELCDEICRHDTAIRLLVVTGGEPMLQQRALIELLDRLRLRRPQLQPEIETNGTLEPALALSVLTQRFVVSPKLQSTGIREELRIRPAALQMYSALPETIFKFVTHETRDLDEIEAICIRCGIARGRVWLMPCALTVRELVERAPRAAQLALGSGYNLSGRWQLLWFGDNARGR